MYWIVREWRRGRVFWEGISFFLIYGVGGRGVFGGVDSIDEFCVLLFLFLGVFVLSLLFLFFGITIVIYTFVFFYSYLSFLGFDLFFIFWFGIVYGFNKSWWNEWLFFFMSFWDILELGLIKYSNLKFKRWKKRDLVYIMSRGEFFGNFIVYFNFMCVGELRYFWKKFYSCFVGVNVFFVFDRFLRR